MQECGIKVFNFSRSTQMLYLPFLLLSGTKIRLNSLGFLMNLSHFCFHPRHAALEGYIHQFLYTYRFFCTAEQLLQFIMDKFLCAAR